MTDAAPVELTPPAGTPPETAATVVASGVSDPGRLAGVTAIWIRELRGRMRGKRAFIFITVYLAILSGLFWASLQIGREFWTIGALESIGFGRGIFGAVMYIEALVIVALAPAYTAGLISSEREKQTFDLLSVTPISSLAIIIGKLLSGLSYLGLIVGASIPIASLAFLFGGIEVADMVRGYAVIVVTGIGIGAIGVWCSAAMHRTQPATVSAFVLTALLVLGATGTWIILDSRASTEGGSRPPEALLYLNPFAAVSDVVCQATGSGCFVAQSLARPPITEMPAAQPLPAQQFGQPQVGAGVGLQPVDPVFLEPVAVGGGFWPKSVIVFLLLTPLALLAAAQSLSPTRRWYWRRRAPAPPPADEPIDD